MTADERAALVRALVDDAPPLSEAQVVRLTALLAPTQTTGSSFPLPAAA